MNAADGDVVSVALKCLHSKATEDHRRALDIVEKVADDDPIACDLLRRNGVTNLLIRLAARATDSSVADRAAAAISSLCGEASKGERTREVTVGSLRVQLHELSYVQVGVGFKTWSSAPALVTLIQRGEVSVSGAEILELGCGTGLVGIAASLLGARSVLMTDYLPEIVANAATNARTNGVAARISTALLDWTKAPAAAHAPPPDETSNLTPPSPAPAPASEASDAPPPPACALHAWRRYHLVLAADVVYSAELVAPLINTLAASLSRAGRAHVVLPPPSVRFCIADFEAQAAALFCVAKRSIRGPDGDELNYYALSWPTN